MRFAVQILFIACVVFVFTGNGTAEPWKVEVNANTTTAVNSYSDNWTGGEAGSFNWASQFTGIAERQFSPKLNNKATLKLQFGQTEIQDKKSKTWDIPQKSSDLIDAEELFRFTLGAWADPYASLHAISQFLDGSDSLFQRYVNPVDMTESVGASRTLKKTDLTDWSTRLGLAVRQYIDRDKLDVLTGNRSTDVTNDGGFELNMDYKVSNAAKWTTFASTLRIYEAVISSKSDEFTGDKENDWRNPHVKWENTLSLTVAKYLMLNLSAFAYYDKDLDTNVRLKETFSAGLTYSYSNTKK